WNYSYQATNELSQALTATNLQNADDTLYVDSGASSHMTHNSCILTDLKHYNGTYKIIIGNGPKLYITHVGNTFKSCLKLKEVLVVPEINKNLLFASSNTSHVSKLVRQLGKEFSVKDLGPLYFFLGVESKYADELLDKAKMTFAKAVTTHLAQKHGLYKAVGSLVEASFYRMVQTVFLGPPRNNPELLVQVLKLSIEHLPPLYKR
uniref:Retrovirus-related Pol polyprotein from transposon TNT 1-94-like beta-barrel domain-containing protein n=1 Tax=Solanum lycopersicum TaxID=4081 RepID=A0A3Q7ID15_SOLLC